MLFTRTLRHVAQGVAALVVAAGAVGVAHYDKAVEVTVDGQPTSLHVFGSTVADVLEKQDITVGPHDDVVPSLDTEVSDGDRISVRYGRLLTVTVDGETKEYWTTATTVDSALDDLNIRAEGAELTASRSQSLGRDGLTFAVTTPKKVTVVADGKTRSVTTTSQTVFGVLAELGVTKRPADIVAPAMPTSVEEGMQVVLKRVDVKKETATESIPFTTTRTNDATLYKGDTKVVTKGTKGTKTVVRSVTYVDGKKITEKVTSTKVLTQPVAAVVKVGTKARPATSTSTSSGGGGSTSGTGINLARADMWDRIAQCESGGRWNINTGNGYYGGLQFATASWLAMGGDDFAPRADLASRAEQITIANRYYERAGLSPWGCAHAA
ncbi:MAG TPA: ubiquitin-like domain-containing protein [Ornithinibacter sp.]|nr:ubiquitin-like domain-containing protein [Ornithinibacter sp.]